MNLVIDLGNTNAKLGVFNGDKLEHHETYPLPRAGETNEAALVNGQAQQQLFEQAILKTQNDYQVQASIISSVINHPKSWESELAAKSKLVHFSHETHLPIAINYDTPTTLGLDRIANAVGAIATMKGQNVLAIDVGTCIKYDLIDESSTFQGGGISPGFQMRFKALNTFTQKLPLIEQQKIKHHVGKNTEESILSGVYNGVKHELEGMINGYSKQYPDLQIIVTGGDASLFELDTKNAIFADAFLTLRGLNLILQHNV